MRTLFILCPLVVLLVGCSKPANENPFFPLQEGRSWTYKVEITYDDPDSRVDSSTLTLTNKGPVMLNGAEAWRRRSDTGNEYWLRTDENGVYRVASRTPVDKSAILDRAPRTVIPAKLTPEAKWSVSTMPYFLRRRNEWPPEFKYVDKFRNLAMDYSVEATDQKVSVPAGEFSGCVQLKGVSQLMLWVESEMRYKEVPMISLEWYCPNEGLVQLERREPTTARFFQGGVMRMTLLKTN